MHAMPMEPTKTDCIKFFVSTAYVFIYVHHFFVLTDARHVMQFSNKPVKEPKLLRGSHRISIQRKFYVEPFSLPPLEPSPMAPLSSSSSPPYTNVVPAPFFLYPPPNAAASPTLSPPENTPSTGTRTPPVYGTSRPPYPAVIPPSLPPSTSPPGPGYTPSPPSSGIRPPPPNGITPPSGRPQSAVWCVSKPSVPDSMVQEAMDYACGSGADCQGIQPNGPCFRPNTLLAHASYAFNSYWQKTKVRGGTCDFGGTAMLVNADPSFDDCHFISN